jgi:hypothetical protein
VVDAVVLLDHVASDENHIYRDIMQLAQEGQLRIVALLEMHVRDMEDIELSRKILSDQHTGSDNSKPARFYENRVHGQGKQRRQNNY